MVITRRLSERHDPRAWVGLVACGVVAITLVPLLYALPPVECVAATLLVIAGFVVPFLPQWRVPYLVAFCYLFPRNLEYHFGWRIPLMERQNGPDYLFTISVVPFDAVLLLTAAALLIPRLLRGERIESRAGWWGVLFVGVYLASIARGYAVSSVSYDTEAAATWSLFRACLLWLTLMAAITDAGLRNRTLYTFLICGVMVALAAVYRYLLSPVSALADAWEQRAASFGLGTGILGGVALMTGLIGLAIFCMHRQRWARLLGLATFAASFASICFTFSRTPFALFVALAAWILWKRSRLLAVGWIAVVGFAIFAALTASELNGRLELLQSGAIFEEGYRMTQYAVSLEMIAEHPIIGVGGFRYYDEAWAYLPSTVLRRLFHSHSLYLHVAAETGLLGLATLLGLFGSLYLRGRRLCRVRDELRPWRVGGLFAFVGIFTLHFVDYMFWDYRFLVALFTCIAITQIPPEDEPAVAVGILQTDRAKPKYKTTGEA